MTMIPGSKVIGSSDEIRALKNPMGALLLERTLFTRRAVLVGLLCTLLFHVVGIWVVPDDFFEPELSERSTQQKEYEILLVDPEVEEVYTQTNPDVPDNVPDETDRFAARNQQAANEEVPDEIDPENMPASESEDDIDTNQFLTGDLEMPVLAPPPVTPQEASQVSEIAPQMRREVPIFGEKEDVEPDGTGVAEYEFEEKFEEATSVAEFLDGEVEDGEDFGEKMDNPNHESSILISQDYVPPAPRARPQLPKVAPGLVRNSNAGVSRVGTIAVDAKFSEFGEYMERLIEGVSAHWTTLSRERKTKGSSGVVYLSFKLTQDGFIEELKTEPETRSKAIGIYLARAAVQDGSPYGVWTKEMVTVLGEDEIVRFSFHYR